MPQSPTALDPDALARQLGGTVSAAPTDAGDPDAVAKQLGGTVTAGNQTPESSIVPGPPTAPPSKPPIDTSLLGVGKRLAAPYDVHTPQGRRNWLGTALGLTAGIATEGMGILPWIASTFAAGTGGMVSEGVDQAMGAKPRSNEAILGAGLEQGAYELGGRAFLWLPRKLTTYFSVAPRVAKQAGEWVEQNLAAAKGSAEALVSEATAKGRAYLKGVRGSTRADVAAAKAAAAENNQIAAENARSSVDAARKVYELASFPSEGAVKGAREGAYATTRTTAPRGPAQVALDLAGQRVEQAAASGPAVPIRPLQTAIEQMLVEAHPGTIFQPEAKSTGIGFLDSMRARRSGEAAAGVATSVDQLKLQERIAKAMGVSVEDLNAPGLGDRVKELTHILGRVMTTKESQIPFADAHRLKLLLDESVNWDTPAKQAMQRITKGARQILREQLSTHEPYNAATADYAKQVQLYRRGAGAKLIKAARDNPDQVVRLLNPKNPAAAQQIKSLLVDQAAKGGNAALGLQTWQHLQSAFTFEHIVKGGVEGLSQRIGTLLHEAPEFARVVFDDPTAQRVLSNYDRIGQAFQTAEQIGKEFVDKTAAAGKASVAAATTQAGEQRIAAKEAVQDLTGAAKRSGQAKVTAARETAKRFAKSSVAQYGKPRAIENELVDVGVAGTHPTSIYGARSIARLLRGPKAAEMLEWAAHSDANTQRLVAALTSEAPPEVTAALMREMVWYAAHHDDDTKIAPQNPGAPRQ